MTQRLVDIRLVAAAYTHVNKMAKRFINRSHSFYCNMFAGICIHFLDSTPPPPHFLMILIVSTEHHLYKGMACNIYENHIGSRRHTHTYELHLY